MARQRRGLPVARPRQRQRAEPHRGGGRRLDAVRQLRRASTPTATGGSSPASGAGRWPASTAATRTTTARSAARSSPPRAACPTLRGKLDSAARDRTGPAPRAMTDTRTKAWAPGDHLTHRFNPDLGIGRVAAIDGRTLVVEFPRATSTLRLAAGTDALLRVDLSPGRPVRVVATREETTVAARLPGGRLRLANGREEEAHAAVAARARARAARASDARRPRRCRRFPHPARHPAPPPGT